MKHPGTMDTARDLRVTLYVVAFVLGNCVGGPLCVWLLEYLR